MTEEFKRYVETVAHYCLNEIHHGEYELRFVYKNETKKDDEGTLAEIDVNPTYLWAKMTIYRPSFEKYDKGDREGVARDVLHEVCHLFIEPIVALFWWDVSASQKEGYTDVIERQIQRTCNAVWGLLPVGWWNMIVIFPPRG